MVITSFALLARRLRMGVSVLALVGVVGLATLAPAAATTPAPSAQNDATAIFDFDYPTSFAGNYLAARQAHLLRDLEAAAEFYSEALRDDPDNLELKERAFTFLVGTGQVDDAVPLAEEIVEAEKSARLARLTLAMDALRRGQFTRARTQLRAGAQGPLADLSTAILTAWTFMGQKRTDEAVKTIDALTGPEWYGVFKNFHAGLILDASGRRKEAVERFAAAYKLDPTGVRLVDAYARSLMRNGRQAEAIETLMAFNRSVPDHPLIQASLTQARAGAKMDPLLSTSREGAGEFLYGLGAAIGREGAEDIGAVYLHLARHVDENAELPLLSLSTLNGQLKRYEAAIDYLSAIEETSPLKPMAEIQVGRYFNLLEKFDEARAHLTAIVDKNPKDVDALMALGEVNRGNKKFAEAAEAYSRAIDAIGTPTAADWALFYYRGISYERTKQWPKAEADFKKALQLNPDEPHVLNYLGYSWIDMGINLDEGLKLVRKAVDLRPDDGYIVDSLGWAYYKLGRYEEAVQELERAVLLRPEDPVINDHLGDAYWKVGRKLEATFQWRHAIDMKPEPDDLPAILKKLQNGLTETPAPAAAQNVSPEQPKAQ